MGEGTGKEAKMVRDTAEVLKRKEDATLPWFIWVFAALCLALF